MTSEDLTEQTERRKQWFLKAIKFNVKRSVGFVNSKTF